MYKMTIEPRTNLGTYAKVVDLSIPNVRAWVNQVAPREDVLNHVSRLSPIRQRLDKSEFQPTISVFGDLTVDMLSRERLFGDFNCPQSVFANHVRDGALLKIWQAGSSTDNLLFSGSIVDRACRWDSRTATEQLKVVSIESVMKRVAPVAGELHNDMNWKDAVRACFNPPEVAAILEFDDDFTHLDHADAIGLDDLHIIDASDFAGKSCWDCLTSLLVIVLGVMRVAADGTCSIWSRNRSTDANPIMIDEVLELQCTPGSGRTISQVRVNVNEGDPVTSNLPWSSQTFGENSQLSFDLNWVGSPGIALAFANWVVDYTMYPSREVKIKLPASPVLDIAHDTGIFDRIWLDLNDAPQLPLQFDDNFSVTPYGSSYDGPYRIIDLSLDLVSDQLEMTLRH